MPGRLQGKVAVISGAARGQGAATAQLFVREGARVLLCDVDDEHGTYVSAQIGDNAWYRHLDVSDERAWAEMVAEVDQAFGRLDVLVNNAGIISFSPLVDTPLAEYERVIRVNQIGTFLGMRECVPVMKRAGSGSIVNVSSVEGLGGMPWLTAYAASKYAIRGMTKVASAELAPHGVRVNTVHPGAIDPAMGATALGGMPIDLGLLGDRVPLGRSSHAEEVASLVLYLASDESAYCTGGEFVADGDATASPAPPPTPPRSQTAMPQAPQWEQQPPPQQPYQPGYGQPQPYGPQYGGGPAYDRRSDLYEQYEQYEQQEQHEQYEQYERDHTPERPWVAEGGRRRW